MNVLTEEEQRRYRQDGIVFPIRVLSPSEVQRYRAECDELELRLGGKPRTIQVRQMHLHFRWAYELATHPRVLDAVEDLLGPNLLVWATELFAKHPQDPFVSVGWHRDKPYLGFDPATTTTAWLALARSTRDNGCMRAIPGAARNIVLPGQTGHDHTEQEQQNEALAVDVILEAGEMSLHDANIVHGSSANRSQEKRVGFVIRFVTPAGQPLTGRPPVIVARGRNHTNHFRVVDPPDEIDGESATALLRQSAAAHLEIILQNLKQERAEDRADL